MKKALLLGTLLVSAAGFFTSCEDDRDSNPTLIQPKEMTLNVPAYVNQTVDLQNSSTLNLTWSQPKYTTDNAPINATYEIQISPTNSFTTSVAQANADESGATIADYDVIPNTFQTCSGEMIASDVNLSLIKIFKWAEGEVPASQTLFVRVLAFIKEGTTRLNEVASNSIELKVAP